MAAARIRRHRFLRSAAGVGAVLLSVVLTAVVFFAIRLSLAPLPRLDVRFAGDWPFEPDPEVGFVAAQRGVTRVLRPDGSLDHAIFTDRRRLRVEAPGDETPGAVDLLTIGGSFAWGHGLAAEETFTARLGRRFGLRVANAALGGYGGVQSLQLLERHESLRPSTIVYAFVEDHLRRNLAPCAPSYGPFCRPVSHVAIGSEGRASLQLPDSRLARADLGERYLRDVALAPPRPVRDLLWQARIDLARLTGPRPPTPRGDPDAREAAQRWVFDSMAGVARRLGARLIVLHVPYLRPGEASAPPPELVAALPPDATLVDLEPSVVAHRHRHPTRTLTLADDAHPNAEAHALMEQALAESLLERAGARAR
jgi:hypothetical protein